MADVNTDGWLDLAAGGWGVSYCAPPTSGFVCVGMEATNMENESPMVPIFTLSVQTKRVLRVLLLCGNWLFRLERGDLIKLF